MSEYLIQGETLTGIADAIRGKTGGTAPVAVSDMAAQIEGIQAGSGDIDALIDRSITEVSSNATSIGDYTFYKCSNLTTADFPVATTIGEYALYGCQKLVNVNFPALTSVRQRAFYGCEGVVAVDLPLVTSVGAYAFCGCIRAVTINLPAATSISIAAFYNCDDLVAVDFPVATSIGDSAFRGCVFLATADFPVATSIGSQVFYYCSRLTSLILRNVDEVCYLKNADSLVGTPIAPGTGYIYVPSALIEQYKVATNWSTYAAQFRALEDYTVDGTVTGELDPAKTGA